MTRTETRAQRYEAKAKVAKSLPFSFCATNFTCDGNIAYLARALACFGGRDIHVIGKKIADNELNRLSGGHSKLVNFVYHSNPLKFLEFAREQNYKLLCAELTDNAVSLHDYKFDYSVHNVIIVGNEMDGVPVELINNSQVIYIPMIGRGFCLNTSQTANVMAYEFAKGFS